MISALKLVTPFTCECMDNCQNFKTNSCLEEYNRLIFSFLTSGDVISL